MNPTFDFNEEVFLASSIISHGSIVITECLVFKWGAVAPNKNGCAIEMAAYTSTFMTLSKLIIFNYNPKDYESVMGDAIIDLTASWIRLANGDFKEASKNKVESYNYVFGGELKVNDYVDESTQIFLDSIRIPGKLNISHGDLVEHLSRRRSAYLDVATHLKNQSDIEETLDSMLLNSIYDSFKRPNRPSNTDPISQVITSYISTKI